MALRVVARSAQRDRVWVGAGDRDHTSDANRGHQREREPCASAGRAQRRFWQTQVGAEVALAFVLLTFVVVNNQAMAWTYFRGADPVAAGCICAHAGKKN